ALGAIKPINKELGEMVGWPELAATVTAARDGLPADQRDRTAIVTGNYGEGSALWHADATLPVWSVQNSMGPAGPPPDRLTAAILVGYDEPHARQICVSPVLAARIHNDAGIDNDEDGAHVWTCDALTAPWSQQWPGLVIYQ